MILIGERALLRAFGVAIAIPIAAFAVAGCAVASSPGSWGDFRAQVAEQCAAESRLGEPVVSIDPFGTESYGIATVTGHSAETGGEATVVCVLRKTPDGPVEAEISAPVESWNSPE